MATGAAAVEPVCDAVSGEERENGVVLCLKRLLLTGAKTNITFMCGGCCCG